MAVDKPVKVKGAAIVTPAQVLSFGGGLDERGDYNIAPDCISFGRNVMVNSSNNLTKRFGKKKWLPDAVGFNGEVSTVYYNDEIFYFIADDGKAKYCQEGDTAWTDCGGANSLNTTEGVITTFTRVNDILLCLNGEDTSPYITLSNKEMVQFTHVNDPVGVITCTATGITTTGPFSTYYAYNYNSNGGGMTAIGPIKTQSVSKSRSTWKTDGTEYLTLAFNDTPPAGATSRNIYAATALQGTTPTASDLVLLKRDVPISDTSFSDNGSIPFDISANLAPDTNSTDGITATKAEIVGNEIVLYGDPNNKYDLLFGVITEDGVSFGGGAQRLPLLKGTNFYPTAVMGFRNNQGVPTLLALFSGTEGVSKQQTITQKTVTYGNDTITYWEPDELNAGAGPVYSKYGAINYLSELMYPSAEGIVSVKTEPNLQNVLQPDIVSEAVADTYSTIKNANFDKIIAAAWKNMVFFSVPSRGYNYNNQILIRDLNNKEKPKWYIWDIIADWIGAVTPPNKAGFVYIREGNKFFKLMETYVAEDEGTDGTSTPFPMVIEGAFVPMNEARNSFFALTQVVFDVAEWVGTLNLEVQWITPKGQLKYKRKAFTNGGHSRNFLAGWANPALLYRSWNNRMINWSTPLTMSGDGSSTTKIRKRLRIRVPNPTTSEVKFKMSTNLENTTADLKSVVYEGVNIGPIGDIV